MGQVGSAHPVTSRSDLEAHKAALGNISRSPRLGCAPPDAKLSKAQRHALMALVMRRAWLLEYFTAALAAPDRASRLEHSVPKTAQLLRVHYRLP